MILSVLFILFFKFDHSQLDERCYAPIEYPEPLPNKTLIYFQVMTRHGMRTPIEILPKQKDQRSSWNCNPPNHFASRTSTSPSNHYRRVYRKVDERMIAYPPTCGNGDLTVEGMEMHYNIGQLYRRYLVDKLHFLPEKFDPSYFKFVSSPVDRCFRSAESFIYGLYEPQNQNEVISIQTGSDSCSSLTVPGENCQEATDFTNEFRYGPIYDAFVNETYPIIKDALNYFGFGKGFNDYDQLCSWVISFMCNPNARFPSVINESIITECFRINSFNQYGMYRQAPSKGLHVSTAFNQAMRIADEALGNSNGQKFTLLSAHDTTIASYMTLLGQIDDSKPPPYASHLAMEIWADESNERYVRYVFNGQPVKLSDFNGETVVRYDEFRTVMAPYVDHCKSK